MAVRKQIPYSSGIFFITFTCSRFLPLFALLDCYDIVYTFFDYLKSKGHFIHAFVIMPNHLHAIISFTKSEKKINRIIGDGKRFMSYEIIKRLKETENVNMLQQLEKFVNSTDRSRGKLHVVFEPSFDWKECDTDSLIEQKLNYIHLNPCVCKPSIAKEPSDYIHSSAKFYLSTEKSIYPIEHVMKMKDIRFD
ncbi:MAG: hypothetical protein KA198_03150 [Chitinophagaceae bacterium]|nr:hypothetical protein [Chitinophagaceae bacterium]